MISIEHIVGVVIEVLLENNWIEMDWLFQEFTLVGFLLTSNSTYNWRIPFTPEWLVLRWVSTCPWSMTFSSKLVHSIYPKMVVLKMGFYMSWSMTFNPKLDH